MEKMSATTMKTILGENAIITPEQERVLADFEIVRSLDLFPQQMWSSVDDFEICHFGTWCHQVLTVHNFDFFEVNESKNDSIREVGSFKFRFRHLFQRARAVNMDYPEFKGVYELVIWLRVYENA